MTKLKLTKKQLREIENDPVVNDYRLQIKSIESLFGPGYTKGIEQDLSGYINRNYVPSKTTILERVLSAVKLYVFNIV